MTLGVHADRIYSPALIPRSLIPNRPFIPKFHINTACVHWHWPILLGLLVGHSQNVVPQFSIGQFPRTTHLHAHISLLLLLDNANLSLYAHNETRFHKNCPASEGFLTERSRSPKSLLVLAQSPASSSRRPYFEMRLEIESSIFVDIFGFVLCPIN